MSLILPESEKPKEDVENLEIKYNATEDDEERFFLMYHLHFQPSEVDALHPDYRKWLIARLVAQKNMEQQMVERHRLMQQLGPNLKV